MDAPNYKQVGAAYKALTSAFVFFGIPCKSRVRVMSTPGREKYSHG